MGATGATEPRWGGLSWCDVRVESRVREALTMRGQMLDLPGGFPDGWAAGQVVMRDERAEANYAGSSPPKEPEVPAKLRLPTG